ncbi:autotransporter outer membrane beta-barrel domain-containing protein [Comamonas thiooxydans]|nr:autotransporter outer membrane beta-barrel domain-containing protein [Comamonas thiooxydans]
MNNIYRTIWNCALGAWVAAPESARSASKSARKGIAGTLVTRSAPGKSLATSLMLCAFATGTAIAGGAGGGGGGSQGGIGGTAVGGGAGGSGSAVSTGGSSGGSSASNGGIGGGGTGGTGGIAGTGLGAGGGGGGGGASGGTGGNGGAGGVAGAIVGSTVIVVGPVTGGNGGAGSNAVGVADGGGGGGGGDGLWLGNGNHRVSAAGSVIGGNGGNGGGGGFDGGGGGGGGSGILLQVTNAQLHVEGSVIGGNGGSGGVAGLGIGTAGAGGSGVSVDGDGNTLVNAGSIVGGLSGNGVTRANAVTIRGSNNTVQLNAGYSFTGNVVVASGLNNALALGGTADTTFGVSDIGARYQGFTRFVKKDTSTWTLTGITTQVTPWSVTGGTLSIAADASLGATSGALTLNGGTLRSTTAISSARAVVLGSSGGTVSPDPGTTLSWSGEVSGSGSLTMSGAGTLTLSGANNYMGGTRLLAGRINVGSSSALGAGALDMADGTTLGFAANNLHLTNAIVLSGVGDPIVDTGSFDGTLSGAISGAGFLTKQGTGTLTLTSTGNNYNGATDVAQGTLKAGAANTFSSASAHTVAAGAVLDLAGYNQTLTSLNNSGTVKLSSNSGAAPGTVLKVTGAYVGNNGNLGLSTVLGADGSATDKLLLSGASAVASGNTTVHITNAGGLGAQTTGNGIEVIGTENGASLQPGSFTLAGGHVDAGAYEYRLTQNAQGAALHSTTTAPTTPTTAYRAEVPLLSALPAQLRQADMAMLGDLRKRMGDEGSQATTSSDTGASRRVWGRILRTDPKISQQGTVSPESSGHLTGFQAGLDLYADQSIKAGIYVGQLEGDMSVKGFASGVERKYVGFNNLRTRYLGVYGTWQDQSGLYADAVLQGADYRSDLRTAGDTAQARTKGSGWLASLEMGKAFELSSHWKIEPQAQIIYRKLSIDDTALSLATVKNKADDDWTVRLGARIKGNFATGAGVLHPYGRINVYKASNTTDIASFAAPGGTTDIKAKGGYTATEMAAGASLQINPRTSIYGELGKLWANGGDSRVKSGVQASMGVKVLW